MAHGPVCAVPGSEDSDFEDKRQLVTFAWPRLRYRVTVRRDDSGDDPQRAAEIERYWRLLEMEKAGHGSAAGL